MRLLSTTSSTIHDTEDVHGSSPFALPSSFPTHRPLSVKAHLFSPINNLDHREEPPKLA